jgi:phosphorylase kinase alpha/beta subunit
MHSPPIFQPLVTELVAKGSEALKQILPVNRSNLTHIWRYEMPVSSSLIYPPRIVDPVSSDAEKILGDVTTHLQGEQVSAATLAILTGFQITPRNFPPKSAQAILAIAPDRVMPICSPGEEAQWCIFDPIISAIYGQSLQFSTRETGRL